MRWPLLFRGIGSWLSYSSTLGAISNLGVCCCNVGLDTKVAAQLDGFKLVPFETLLGKEPDRGDSFVSRNTLGKDVVLNFCFNLDSSSAKGGPSNIVIRLLMESFPTYGPSILA